MNADRGQDTDGDVPDNTLHLELLDIDLDMDVLPNLPEKSNGAPKTMLELAEEAARKEKDIDLRDPNDKVADEEEYGSPSVAHTIPVDKRRSTRSSKFTHTDKSTLGTKRKAPTQSNRGSTKKKATNEYVDSDTEAQSSTQKRGKAKTAAIITPTDTPTRVLRPRTSKSQSQIQEEMEKESALKQAMEE
jgi:xeroderma pigmentosum group C-complementing protein